MLIENIEKSISKLSDNKKIEIFDSNNIMLDKSNFSDKIDEFLELPKRQNSESNIYITFYYHSN